MTPDHLLNPTCYPSARQGREDAYLCIDSTQKMSLTCRLAFDDSDFLVRDEMRGVRPQLELMKPVRKCTGLNITLPP